MSFKVWFPHRSSRASGASRATPATATAVVEVWWGPPEPVGGIHAERREERVAGPVLVGEVRGLGRNQIFNPTSMWVRVLFDGH